MRLDGVASWRIETRSDLMVDCALWILAAERLPVPPDPIVPETVDLEHPPAPISSSDDAIAGQWLGWWYSLILPQRQGVAPDATLEPAYGTPDPLGLAPYPELARIVEHRFPEAHAWHILREREWVARHQRAPMISEIVRDVERTAGRRVRPFSAELLLLPVRDEVVRTVEADRYLVPHHLYEGPGWADWVRELATRLGL